MATLGLAQHGIAWHGLVVLKRKFTLAHCSWCKRMVLEWIASCNLSLLVIKVMVSASDKVDREMLTVISCNGV